jgi:hypothetical protein
MTMMNAPILVTQPNRGISPNFSYINPAIKIVELIATHGCVVMSQKAHARPVKSRGFTQHHPILLVDSEKFRRTISLPV